MRCRYRSRMPTPAPSWSNHSWRTRHGPGKPLESQHGDRFSTLRPTSSEALYPRPRPRQVASRPPPTRSLELAEQNWVQPRASSTRSASPRDCGSALLARGPRILTPSISCSTPAWPFGAPAATPPPGCVSRLSEAVTPDCSVLDYGCAQDPGDLPQRGSAPDRCCMDVDGGPSKRLRRRRPKPGQLKLQHSTAAARGTQYQLVVANILPIPLCVLAPAIAARRTREGLALSGVLVTQARTSDRRLRPFIALAVGQPTTAGYAWKVPAIDADAARPARPYVACGRSSCACAGAGCAAAVAARRSTHSPRCSTKRRRKRTMVRDPRPAVMTRALGNR